MEEEDANALCVKPQEDLTGSFKSSKSELVASELDSLRSLCGQHSKSCTNLDELVTAEKSKGPAQHYSGGAGQQKNRATGAMVSELSGARPLSPDGRNSVDWLAGCPSSLFESGYSHSGRSTSTSYLSSLRRNPKGGSFMYSTGPITKEILKKKLVEPGHNLEKIMKHTIPNVATMSVSIVSCVSDCFTHKAHVMGLLTISLMGEAKKSYHLNLKSFKVNFRCAVKEKNGNGLCREPEESFDIWEESSKHTFQFKVGTCENLKKLMSEAVIVECDIGVVPINKYRLSLTSDFLDISIKKGVKKAAFS